MAIKEMTVYEALEERKVLEARVNKIPNNTVYSTIGIIKTGMDEAITGQPVEEFRKSLQSAYDSAAAIINNYIALKAAINNSNAVTEITVGDKTFTIANALMRQRLLSIERNYWMTMQADVRDAERQVKETNEKVRKQLDDHIESMFKDAKTKNEDAIQVVTDTFTKGKYIEVYDPLNIKDKAQKRLEELDEFQTKLSFALTQSNCNTKITVEYED